MRSTRDANEAFEFVLEILKVHLFRSFDSDMKMMKFKVSIGKCLKSLHDCLDRQLLQQDATIAFQSNLALTF